MICGRQGRSWYLTFWGIMEREGMSTCCPFNKSLIQLYSGGFNAEEHGSALHRKPLIRFGDVVLTFSLPDLG